MSDCSLPPRSLPTVFMIFWVIFGPDVLAMLGVFWGFLGLCNLCIVPVCLVYGFGLELGGLLQCRWIILELFGFEGPFHIIGAGVYTRDADGSICSG